MTTIRSLLTVVHDTLYLQSVEYAIAIVDGGILGPLIKAVTMEPVNSISDPSLACEVLMTMLPYLVYDKMVDTCRGAFEGLQHQQTKNLLGKTRREFQASWKVFEDVLLERSILSRLSKRGFAPELGVCASVSMIFNTSI